MTAGGSVLFSQEHCAMPNPAPVTHMLVSVAACNADGHAVATRSVKIDLTNLDRPDDLPRMAEHMGHSTRRAIVALYREHVLCELDPTPPLNDMTHSPAIHQRVAIHGSKGCIVNET